MNIDPKIIENMRELDREPIMKQIFRDLVAAAIANFVLRLIFSGVPPAVWIISCLSYPVFEISLRKHILKIYDKEKEKT